MALVAVERKKTVRTPEQLAKWHAKQAAIGELKGAGLPDHATITVDYGGKKYELRADVTVNIKSGQVMFYAGANGTKRMPFTFGKNTLEMGFGANLFTGTSIDSLDEIRAAAGLPKLDKGEPVKGASDEDDEMSDGEQV